MSASDGMEERVSRGKKSKKEIDGGPNTKGNGSSGGMNDVVDENG